MSEMGKFQKQYEELFSNAQGIEEYIKKAEGLKIELESELASLQGQIVIRRQSLEEMIKNASEEVAVLKEGFDRTRVSEMARIKEKEDVVSQLIIELEGKIKKANQDIGRALATSGAANKIIEDMEKVKQDYIARNTELDKLDKGLSQKEIKLKIKEESLNSLNEVLNEREAGLTLTNQDIQQQVMDNSKLAQLLKEKGREISCEAKELTAQQVELKKKEFDLGNTEKELAVKNSILATKEKNLKDKEANLENFQKELEFNMAKFKRLKESVQSGAKK